LARFTVVPNPYQSDYTPVWVNLDLLTNLDENSLQLVEIMEKSVHPVPFQIEQGNPRKLYWILSTAAIRSNRVFELRKGEPHPETEMITVSDHDGSLEVMSHHKPVLTYQYKTVYPPAGVDSFYKRSGFLHPVYAPDGAVLTNIQPKDHYHHYGIWNPWTKTSYEGKEIDFWNLSKHEGTVRFSGLISKLEGPVFGGFSAYQKHIVHPDSSEVLAINEIWDLKVFNTGEKEFLWDFTSTLNVPLKEIVLETYRYGGFGFRATEV
jgi:hypothetical protein